MVAPSPPAVLVISPCRSSPWSIQHVIPLTATSRRWQMFRTCFVQFVIGDTYMLLGHCFKEGVCIFICVSLVFTSKRKTCRDYFIYQKRKHDPIGNGLCVCMSCNSVVRHFSLPYCACPFWDSIPPPKPKDTQTQSHPRTHKSTHTETLPCICSASQLPPVICANHHLPQFTTIYF